MFARTIRLPRQRITNTAIRTLFIVTLVMILTVTLVAVAHPAAVYAAPAIATSGRQDRRPDRERPVVTSTTTPSGGGTIQEGGSTATQPRPRLVRH